MDAPRYYTDRLELSLTGPLTREKALRLRDAIELAIEYYFYREVNLILDSPGGEIGALDLFLSELARWRKEHELVLRTRVLGESASAAAFLLCMGTRGKRSASSAASRILLHEPRALINGAEGRFWTRAEFEHTGRQLQESADRLVDMLAGHVFAGASNGSLSLQLPGGEQRVSVRSEGALSCLYRDLMREDRWLSAGEAIGLGLIDTIKGSSRLPHADEREPHPGRTP